MRDDQRDQSISTLDEFLTVMGCSESPRAMHYSGAYLMTQGRGDGLCVDDRVISVPGMQAVDLDCKWGASVLMSPYADECLFTMKSSQTLHWSSWSRCLKHVPGYDYDRIASIARYDCEAFDREGNTLHHTEAYTLHEDFKYRVVDPHAHYVDTGGVQGIMTVANDKSLKGDVDKIMGLCFLEPSFWVAEVSIQKGLPSVRIITDPTGIKELWKYRDVPEGLNRRAALLNWVSDHWRKNRKDPDVEHYVRKHLRGRVETTCSGMHVKVHASPEDLVEVWELAGDREKLRESGKDRRKRFRRR